jgi:Domain of unknown function (DUF4177)
MQRWEYRVVSLRDGQYTQSLNEYGREGWELVTVATVPREAPTTGEKGGRRLPVPGLGKLEGAAAALNKLEGSGDDVPEATVQLLWVLRRPLPEPEDYDAEYEEYEE